MENIPGEEYEICLDKFSAKKENWRLKSVLLSILIIFIVSTLYYKIIGIENLLIFLLITIFSCVIIIYAIHAGLKDVQRMWRTFKIVLTEECIQFDFEQPSYGEFERTSWKKRTDKVKWVNARLKNDKEAIIIDKSTSRLQRILFGKGKYKIPIEVTNRNQLLEKIEQKINMNTKQKQLPKSYPITS